MDKRPGYQERTSANKEDDIIASHDISLCLIKIKYKPYKKGKQHASDGAKHSSQPHYGTNGFFREHIRNNRKILALQAWLAATESAINPTTTHISVV